MKVKLILDLDGDFEDELSDKEVEEITKIVISNGAEVNSLSSKIEVLEIIEK